jgi:hypothetical protein
MTISGYKIHNAKLNHWQLLLREWIQCFERLCDFTGTTPAWNSQEDSNSGPFAGAVWRLGWVAFPEIKSKRTSLGGYGEVDFYLACPPFGIAEYVECKGNKIWSASQAAAQVAPCLSEAVRHAATIIDPTVSLRIGVAFCNVLFQRTQKEAVPSLVEQCVAAVCRDMECDAIGWCFPQSVCAYEEEPGVFNPGVILLARVAEQVIQGSEAVFPGQ